MNQRRSTREVQRGDASRFLRKAKEFAASARSELVAGRHSAASLASVHAAISASDAVSTHVAGVVSVSRDHSDAVALLRESLGGGLPRAAERQFLGLIRMKHDVEYTQSSVSPARARVLVDQSVRFVQWAESVVNR